MSMPLSIIQRFLILILLAWQTSVTDATPEKADSPPSALTPLTRAIRLEKFEQAKKHITPELVNKMDQGQYHPLTYATYTRNQQLVKALLDGGADPNIIEHDGATALSIAAQLRLPEMIKTLHQAGATYPSGKNATLFTTYVCSS